jgi:hypothetical protein
VVEVGTSKDLGLYNKPAGCGVSGGISYRNPTLKNPKCYYFETVRVSILKYWHILIFSLSYLSFVHSNKDQI